MNTLWIPYCLMNTSSLNEYFIIEINHKMSIHLLFAEVKKQKFKTIFYSPQYHCSRVICINYNNLQTCSQSRKYSCIKYFSKNLKIKYKDKYTEGLMHFPQHAEIQCDDIYTYTIWYIHIHNMIYTHTQYDIYTYTIWYIHIHNMNIFSFNKYKLYFQRTINLLATSWNNITITLTSSWYLMAWVKLASR